MKARHIRKLRLKSKDINYLKNELRYWAKEEAENEDFYRWECRETFVGRKMSEINDGKTKLMNY